MEAIGLLTGHCGLLRDLFTMGISKDPSCKGCRASEKPILHILCECKFFSAQHFDLFGHHSLEPWEIQDIPVKGILKFITVTSLFQDGRN